MLRNYLKITLRTLRGRPGVTVINVLGLAVGLAACLLIGLWVQHELSYDDFHPEADRTYRVTFDAQLQDRSMQAPLSPAPMGATLVQEFPEVQTATRVGLAESATVRVGERSFRETQVLSADSTFFAVFSGFRLRHGDPATALDVANAVVLTASTARKYFGTANPVGKTLTIDGKTRQVTGVLADVPSNSHLSFTLIEAQDLSPQRATQWAGNSYYTYLRLGEGASVKAFDAKLDRFVENRVVPQLEETLGIPLGQMLTEGARYQYDLQPLTDIYLQSDSSYEAGPTGSLTTVYVFGAVGLFILLIACVNFMNLATARASERATEVGVRKAMGAGRSQLAGQFVGEAVLTTVGAFGLSLGLAYLARPLFTQLSGVPLVLSDLWSGPVLLGLMGGVVLIGILAGSYPALVLSRYDPSVVLKVNERRGSGGGPAWMRRGLVVVQFVISIAMIAGTLVVWQQYEFIQTKQLGLDEERIVVLDRGQALGARQQAFLDRVRRHPGIVEAGAGDGVFDVVSASAFAPADASASASTSMNFMNVTARFVETMDVEVVAGRSFDAERAADSSAVLFNEAAAQALGWSPDDAVGRTIREVGGSSSLTVIGVVDNFHYQSLRQRIQPLVLRHGENGRQVFVRFAPGTPDAALDQLRTAWDQFGAAGPLRYTFLDQTFDQLHRSTQRTGQLLGVFALLAIFVACLGLFGLATYTVQRRTKEIGIRKALGATGAQVVVLVSREFAGLVTAAFVVASPLVYVGMTEWLSDFAYRTDVGLGVLLGAGAVVLLTALLTVSLHALRAARIDPARTLRSE